MGKRSFFWSLAKDPTANTIVISAAALVPLIGMVGGAVDASRYYMTTTRLQAACDAGALAARRSMDNDTFENSHKQVGLNFFDQNYEDGLFGLDNLSRDYTSAGDGVVNGTASGDLPTTLMNIFGFGDFELAVDCSAEINISNTDIMFVLDVTGSMNCAATSTSCTNNGNVEATNSKISNLRTAVLNFYDTVESATSSSAQVRYGIVPYSSAVNVGNSLDTAWMASSHTYQSREPDSLTTDDWVPDEVIGSRRTSGAWSFTGVGNIPWTYNDVSYSECVNLTSTQSDIYHESDESSWTLVSAGSGNPRTSTYQSVVRFRWKYRYNSGNYNSATDTCTLYFTTYEYSAWAELTVREEFMGTDRFAYGYRPVSYDLTSLYSNGSFTAPTGTGGANETHTWAGCIEEATTDNVASFDPIPAGANDLDIDLVPNSTDEYWKPAINSLIFFRYDDAGNWTRDQRVTETNWSSNPTDYCPKAARKLATFGSRQDLSDWLSASNGFRAFGATYHDYGMIWGARFISPDGIFASENATAPNGDAIGRHIIFMTDGTQATSQSIYGLYGVEWWDRRVTTDGSQSQMAARHAARFQAACKAARNKNISVWVVAFGTTLTSNLTDCASPGRAFSASNAAQLDAKFQEIAQKIAALRLTS